MSISGPREQQPPTEVYYSHTPMTHAPPTEQPHKLLAMSAALRAATQRPRGGSKERVTHQHSGWVTNGCRICDILMHYFKGHAAWYDVRQSRNGYTVYTS